MAVSNVKKESFLRFLNEKHNASEYWSSTFRKDTDATLEGLWEMRVEARLWEVALQKRGVHEELTPIVFAALKGLCLVQRCVLTCGSRVRATTDARYGLVVWPV